MTSANVAAISAFIHGAPPGELADVVSDIKTLTVNEPALLESAKPAFQKYNEEQLTVVKLPGSGKNALVSSYTSLGDGRYYDVERQSSFAFDYATQKASVVQPYSIDTQHSELITALYKSLSTHTSEHYPNSTLSIVPTDSDSTLAILVAANKYSPSNFWNGRFRTIYLYRSPTLSGTLKCDVHYYEDGNVRLTTTKPLASTPISVGASLTATATAVEIAKTIAAVEKRYQEELNRGFARLSEGEFKALRRQLPVTRQKVEWEKIGGYRLGQDIGGGRSR